MIHNRSGRNPDFVFLVYRGGLGPTFVSSCLRPAALLGQRGFGTGMVITSELGEWTRKPLRDRWRQLQQTINEQVPNGVVRLPAPPRRWRAWPYEVAAFRAWLRAAYHRDQAVVFYSVGSFATALALEGRKIRPNLRVMHQCWGPEAAEYEYHTRAVGGKSVVDREATLRDIAQRRAFEQADLSICISDSMINWASERYTVDQKQLVKIPCYVDALHFAAANDDREGFRRSIGLEDRFVVVYCGSTLKWQLPPGVFEVFHSIKRRVPNAHFLGVTQSRNTLVRMLTEHGIGESDHTVVSVNPDEVPAYLAAADLGILGRGLMCGPSVVNRISSPVKFGEYLAAGTPVVMSEGVGDFSAMVEQHGVGLLLPCDATREDIDERVGKYVSMYKTESQESRLRCRQLAANELDISQWIGRLGGCYQALIGTRNGERNVRRT